ncbi:tellurite resistance protein TerA [Janthinobacterium sp. CG_23.3]|uniref:TerD family protein n=1 Tax=Janthinobacterium sp. CG_23.3 TaxID=3349634 RepID=UPI0038D402B4
MSDFGRGQKGKLADMECAGAFPITLNLAASGMSADVVCFGLDEAGKLSDDRYMVFFNQKASPGGAVTLETAGEKSVFVTDVAKLPDSIHRLVFAASIDGEGTMRQLGQSSMTLGTGIFNFAGADFDNEKAVIVGEVYKRDGLWRFGAVGQGFSGGLAALLSHFGGAESGPVEAAAPVPAPSKISLSKVSLTKVGQSHSISLVKGPAAPRKLVVKATWEDNGDGEDDNDDLDLRVGILLADGRMKFVSAPNFPGDFDSAPFVKHLGDIKVASAKEPATETVEVNPAIAQHCGGRVALVFSVYSAVGNGAVSVASLKPKMRMEYGDQIVECAFDFSGSKAAKDSSVYTYVIGMAVIDGDSIVLAPSGQTSESGSESTPWLQWDGKQAKMTMDGPVVFKDDDADLDCDSPHRYC